MANEGNDDFPLYRMNEKLRVSLGGADYAPARYLRETGRRDEYGDKLHSVAVGAKRSNQQIEVSEAKMARVTRGYYKRLWASIFRGRNAE